MSANRARFACLAGALVASLPAAAPAFAQSIAALPDQTSRIRLSNHDVNHIVRSEEHTSELQSLMRISYAVFCLKKKKTTINKNNHLKTYIHIDRIRINN